MTAVEGESRSSRGRRCSQCSPHSSPRDRRSTSYTEEHVPECVSLHVHGGIAVIAYLGEEGEEVGRGEEEGGVEVRGQ